MKRGFLGCLILFAILLAAPAARAQDLLEILRGELDRNFSALKEKGDPKPYYLSYQATDVQTSVVDASLGALRSSDSGRQRVFDVSVRVGEPAFDNYHRSRGGRARFTSGSGLVLEDKPPPIQRVLWRDTDRAYRAAAERLALLKSTQEVKVEEKDQSPDFSDAPAVNDIRPLAVNTLDRKAWEPRVRKWSAMFKGKRGILTSQVNVTAIADNRYFADSDGIQVRHGRTFVRLTASAQAKASDGMNLGLDRSFEAEKPEGLPTDGMVEKAIEELIGELQGLLAAPEAEPFVGPAILSGSAAAVFFHEIFGHRMEGHRQKDENEGQTFTEQVGKPVLPPFLSVISDPTRKLFEKQDLMGWYAYDDEGVKAQRVPLVESGVLRNFLMSRSPIEGFAKSNGHGRRAPGAEVVSRQSNLMVEAAETVPEARLREMLLEEVRRQSKPYGLYFARVTGGFTTTGRAGLQAFTVIPLVVYRVYADGRPDQLVRGVDIVGTPLASFSKIAAAAEGGDVFNGYCGAESGNIPVAAVSPALLIREIETQRRAKAEDRPPLLNEPALGGGVSQ
ncbi:MAG: metallopeptidase TldD-related protein [Bryobacterales bacterium]|nr:metallopeptidase TldD-related protein [Bryobacterales bacterium]